MIEKFPADPGRDGMIRYIDFLNVLKVSVLGGEHRWRSKQR